MSEKNDLQKNDELREKFAGIDRMVTAPANLVEAVKKGEAPMWAGNRYTAGFHVRKFAKAAVAYAVCVAVLLGVVFLLPQWFNSKPPVGSDFISTSDSTVNTPSVTEPMIPADQYQPIQPVGNVPTQFQVIVENNLFNLRLSVVEAYEDCVVTVESDKKNTSVIRYSLLGEQQVSYTREYIGASPWFVSVIPTEDRGLFAVYFHIEYADYIKIAADGTVEWEYRLETYRWLVAQQLYEGAEDFYAFGDWAEESNNEISLLKISKDGQSVITKTIGGSSYESFCASEMNASGFVLYCHCQSDDGVFEGLPLCDPFTNRWVIEVDADLNIVSMEAVVSFPDHALSDIVGVWNGVQVKQDDFRFAEYDGGDVELLIDYGDQYMIVSENISGEIETPPEVSARWYYTETVYSMFSEDGTLLWRAAKDSTPSWLIQ